MCRQIITNAIDRAFLSGIEYASELLALKMGENAESFKDACLTAWAENKSNPVADRPERPMVPLGTRWTPDADEGADNA